MHMEGVNPADSRRLESFLRLVAHWPKDRLMYSSVNAYCCKIAGLCALQRADLNAESKVSFSLIFVEIVFPHCTD